MTLSTLLKDKPLPIRIRRPEWDEDAYFTVESVTVIVAVGRWHGMFYDERDTIELAVEGYGVLG